MIHGNKAIAIAEETGRKLAKHADPTEGAREITIDEARAIVKEDPSLVYVVEIAADGKGDFAPSVWMIVDGTKYDRDNAVEAVQQLTIDNPTETYRIVASPAAFVVECLVREKGHNRDCGWTDACDGVTYASRSAAEDAAAELAATAPQCDYRIAQA